MIVECRCGCGKKFKISNSARKRMKRGMNSGYVRGHATRGSNNCNWIGGKHISNGYIYVLAKDHPNATKSGHVLEHRLIMEKKIGRYLERREVVHHINGDGTDNRFDNLVLMQSKEHKSHHWKGANNPRYDEKIPKVCPTCKVKFVANHRNHKKQVFCSRACIRRYH